MGLQQLAPYLVKAPQPLIGSETIQLVLFREILDYTILRTEETRELNTVVVPLSIQEMGDSRRVAFFGGKQKAVESRQLERMLRTAMNAAEMGELDCYLKDRLCLGCPRCALFGGTNVQSASVKYANIKHRIEYGTAFSLLTFEEVESATTFNAIDDKTLKTGQALGVRYAVRPSTLFPAIITLKSVTWSELVLTIKTLLAAKSYGAETRVGGDMRNIIVAIVAGWEEVITSLELTLELYDCKDRPTQETVADILEKYKAYAGNPAKVTILTPRQVDGVVKEAANTPLDKKFLTQAFKDVEAYRAAQKG